MDVGQSAIEYLMTYGWMLLVVAIAGGAIFSITDLSTESVSGFQGQDVIVTNFGQSSYGGLDLQLFRANPGVEKVSSIKIENTSVPVNVVFPSGNEDLASHPLVVSTSGINSLDVDIIYTRNSIEGVVSSGVITGGYEVDSPQGLVGFWPLTKSFQEENQFYDISENRNDGSGSNIELVEEDRGGSKFSGDPVTIPHSSEFNLGEELTVSLYTRGIDLDTQQSPGSLTEVSTCTELQNIDPSGNYYLSTNIDCSGVDFTPIGWGTGDQNFDGEEFTGYLDGKGHTISNVSIAPSGDDYYGSMFPIVGTEGELLDFTIEDSDSTGTNPSGLISAKNNGLIRDITVIDSEHTGGNYRAGLITGDNYGVIRNVGVRDSNVDAGNNYVGGLVGLMFQGSIENSYYRGEAGDSTTGDNVGGIAGGASSGRIQDVYSVVNITGSSNTGTLVGELETDIQNGYWDNEKSTNSEALGNQNDGDYEIESRNTAQMKDEDELNMFNFNTRWKFVSGENQGYPIPRFSEMNLFSKGNEIEIKGSTGGSEWHNLVVTYNQSTASYYVDGVLQNQEPLASPISDNTQDILIGDNARGIISDVMIFDRELSQSEVQNHYERWTG